MSETAPAAPAVQVPASMDKPQARKRVKKPVGLTGVNRKTASASVSKLITEALSVSQERAGMSLTALKKALSAAGYDVEKNNSRIKLGLKGLVSKGILVQTRGIGASGSLKLSKKAVPELVREKSKNLLLRRVGSWPYPEIQSLRRMVKPTKELRSLGPRRLRKLLGTGGKLKEAKTTGRVQ